VFLPLIRAEAIKEAGQTVLEDVHLLPGDGFPQPGAVDGLFRRQAKEVQNSSPSESDYNCNHSQVTNIIYKYTILA
jgi:hypothetical protein